MNLPLTQYFHLPTGLLTLNITHSDLPISQLFDIGARLNPKRAFLFVSKLLGKHIPCSPFAMHSAYAQLTSHLTRSLSWDQQRPVIFIGMAETATALAQGIFEIWLAQNPNAQALYLQTTRLRVKNATVCPFEEVHSHASNQFLHLPTDPTHLAMLDQAEQLVLIDDELSTGNTFRNLYIALHSKMPRLTASHWVCLTDFSAKTDDKSLHIERHSLLAGNWHFESDTADIDLFAPPAQGKTVFVEETPFGRTGISRAIHLPESLLSSISSRLTPQDNVLVIGVGEFIHPPTVFARELAKRSQAQVVIQSSTRSPALEWGALQHKRTFPDPYDEGATYYLYNLPEEHHYSHIFICHEHPANHALQSFAKEINAELIHLKEEEDI